MPYIKALVKTVLKTHPVDSKSTALPADFALYNTGPEAKPLAAVKVIRDIAQHARIEFNPHLTIAGKQYKHLYIFAPHWEGVTALINAQVAQASPLSPAGSSIVERPTKHFAQVNNHDWADDGTASNLRYGGVQCGLSSWAIVGSEPGFLTDAQLKEIMAASPTGKFDDGVAAIFKKIGAQSTSMEGHQAVFRYFGIDAICTRNATVAELKAHIEIYSAAILGTMYGGGGEDADASGSGHFVGATGFDIKKNLMKILDPFGIRDKQSTNRWEIKFNTENDVKTDWWAPDTMADLWATTQDGWCVLPKPKGKAIVLPAATPAVGAAAAPATITILKQTWLKQTTAAAGTLADANKRVLAPGPFTCEVVGAKESHGQVKLPDGSLWFIFNAHFKGQEAAAGQTANTAPRDCCVDPTKLRTAVGKLANPNVPAKELDDFCAAFLALAPKYTITKREHAIHFLAQCFHESGGMMYLEELASGDDYTDRDDLGNCEPAAIAAAKGMSVGAWFKGAGLVQLTGFFNYREYGKAAGIDAVNNPDLIKQYPHALGAALYFWSSRGPSLSVDAEGGINDVTCKAITKIVNGGSNGISDRLHYMDEFAKML